MATLIEHLIKLTDHRDRDLLELTLSKALIDLIPIQRVLVSKVVSEEGVKRWMDVTVLDARGGGKVVDPLRIDFQTLPLLEDNRDRLHCIQTQERVEIAWAGEAGPRITYLPLFADPVVGDEGVLEIHSASALQDGQLQTVGDLSRVFRNMYRLLAYSDRDALTGLLNRKSLDDTFLQCGARRARRSGRQRGSSAPGRLGARTGAPPPGASQLLVGHDFRGQLRLPSMTRTAT